MADPCATCPLYECRTDAGVVVRSLDPLSEAALLAHSCLSAGEPGKLRWEMTRIELLPSELDTVLALMDVVAEVHREYGEFQAAQANRAAR